MNDVFLYDNICIPTYINLKKNKQNLVIMAIITRITDVCDVRHILTAHFPCVFHKSLQLCHQIEAIISQRRLQTVK